MKTTHGLTAVGGVVCLVGSIVFAGPSHAAGGITVSDTFRLTTDSESTLVAAVLGIGGENEVIEQRTVSPDGRERAVKVPGRLKCRDVTLRRALGSDLTWYKWRKSVEEGQMTAARKDASIAMLDANGRVVATWKLLRAWPSSLTEVSPASSATGLTYEEMTLACEGWTRQ